MRKQLLSVFTFCLISLAFIACKEKIEDQIVGDWKVTSFKLDGVEQLGSTDGPTSFIMGYEAIKDKEGDYTWVLSNDAGEKETYTGTYEIDEEDKELTINLLGSLAVFQIDISEDDLDINGTFNSTLYDIKAERD